MKHMKRYALRKKLEINDMSHIIKSFQIQTLNGVAEKQLDSEGNYGKAKEGHFFKVLQDEVEMHESEEFPG